MSQIDPNWHQNQVQAFSDELVIYQEYAEFLRQVLLEICKAHAPLAMVQARAKTVPSFAEKAVRKWPRVQEPVNDFDDLCGGRVVALTQGEVEKIGQVIEKEFQVNDARSGDKRLELASTQFGYLAKHYVVQLKSTALQPGAKVWGIEVPPNLGKRMAEIQVKTLLQHAWASVSHDSLYKNQFEPPEKWHRRMARLAALLEEADQGFNTFLKDQAALAGDYSVYMSAEKMKQETGILEVMLGNVSLEQQIGIALRLASLLKAQEQWQQVIEKLEPYGDGPVAKREMGYAKVRLAQEKGDKNLAREGKDCLMKVVQEREDDHLAHYYLGQAYDQLGQQQNATPHYSKAYELYPESPYYLMAYVQRYLSLNVPPDLNLLQPALRQALRTCREHASLGIELPDSLLTCGRLALLLGDSAEALGALLEALLRCPDAALRRLPDELDSLPPKGAEELRLLMNLALTAIQPTKSSQPGKTGKTAAAPPKRTLGSDLLVAPKVFSHQLNTPDKERKPKEVIILAGSSHSSFNEQMETYFPDLLEALKDFRGVVVCGGTDSGISGVVGKVAAKLAAQGDKKFDLIGYLPAKNSLPANAKVDPRYDKIVHTKYNGFSMLESLQTWLDLTGAGIEPDRVRVMGFGGGVVSGLEYRLGLAMGSQVGVVADSGRAADEVLRAVPWKSAPKLLPLPHDPMTFKAFTTFLPKKPAFGKKALEQAARVTHENYLKQSGGNDYAKLKEELKDSNRQQVLMSVKILEAAGFAVKKVKHGKADPTPPKSYAGKIEEMAKMEHGRWNVEKLSNGYRPAAKKDEDRKLHDCIVPWEKLPQKTRNYDETAVKGWPAILAAADLEINDPNVKGKA